MTTRYSIILTPVLDGDSRYWEAEVPALPGCGSHGKTAREALVSILDAQVAWLDTATEDGRDIPLDTKDPVAVRVDGLAHQLETTRAYLKDAKAQLSSHLPNGKTCGDCAHMNRCEWLISCDPQNTRCDWAPHRFVEVKATEKDGGQP